MLAYACWALSHISKNLSNDKLQAVIDVGVCRRLVELLAHALPEVQSPALRAVGNIVTGDDLQTQAMLNFGVLPKLLSLLSSPKKAIRKDACWTISNITEGCASRTFKKKKTSASHYFLQMALDSFVLRCGILSNNNEFSALGLQLGLACLLW